MDNQIIAIGWTGTYTCYIGISRDEAVARWKKETGEDEVPEVRVIPINDGKFEAYSVWEA